MRLLVVLSLAFGVTLASARAHATDTAACLSASEKGQRARTAGKLREARDQFLVCGSEGCPAIVRRDCSQWQAELVSMTPSVVFGAKDRQGRDLIDVVVTMDGEPLVTKLDGKSVMVDPGAHTFKFDVQGQPPVIERALVKEGEKMRAIAVTFGSQAVAGRAEKTENARANDDDRVLPTDGRGHTALPWLVVGLGAAALVTGGIVVLTAPARPGNCNAETARCARLPNQSDEDLANDQDTAGRSDSQPTLGLITGGIGLGIVAGGLLWHFLEPTGPASSALRISPWTTSRGSAGVTLGGSF